jgi:isoamylase
MTMKNYPGEPYPLGATWKGNGVNFALYADKATKVEICLFKTINDEKEYARIELTERTHQIWHTFIPDIKRKWPAI